VATLSGIRGIVDADVRVGVASCDPFLEAADEIQHRVDEGLNGGLGFTYTNPSLSTTPRASFPWASSIVVAAVPYLVEGDGRDSGRTVARFADGDRYERVRSVLGRIETFLSHAGHRCEVVFDDDRLVDRAVAIRAGVAWSGKSTMALTPGHGPWFLIGSVVTDADLEYTDPMVRGCGTCVACIPACPTDAIIAPGVLDASRCLAAVLQRPGDIPPTLRTAVGERIYGCDDCLTACPPGDRALDALGSSATTPSAVEILSMTDVEIEAIAQHWYVPKRNMRFVRRNALIALGNAGGVSALGILAGYLGHPDSLLRSHAAWALGAIGTESAEAVLTAAASVETDPAVLSALREACLPDDADGVYADPHQPTGRVRVESE